MPVRIQDWKGETTTPKWGIKTRVRGSGSDSGTGRELEYEGAREWAKMEPRQRGFHPDREPFHS